MTLSGDWRGTNASDQDWLPALRSYVEKRLRPALGMAGEIKVACAQTEGLSSVFFLNIDGAEPLVLRVHARRKSARIQVKNHDRLSRLGIKVPRIIHIDTDFATRKRWGGYMTVEQRVPGELAVHYEDKTRLANLAAETYAPLHSQTLTMNFGYETVEWIRHAFQLGRKLQRRQQRRARLWLSSYRSQGLPHADALEKWVSRELSAGCAPTPRLCHGDAYGHNMIVNAGGLTLIDLDPVTYDIAAMDYARICVHLFEWDEALCECFHKRYAELVDHSLLAEIQAASRLSLMLEFIRLSLHKPVQIPYEKFENQLDLKLRRP